MNPSIDPEELQRLEANRGRLATRPSEISLRGWWDVLWRVKDQLDGDNVSIVAAGLALFALLAIFPSLAATVAIYGIVASPDAIVAQAQAFSGLLPPAGIEILQLQLDKLIAQRSDTLSVGAALGVILALSTLYRLAPHRARARWTWVNAGSVIASTLWLLSGIVFAAYVRNFDSFGAAYGALGGVVVMLMWFYVSAYVVILQKKRSQAPQA